MTTPSARWKVFLFKYSILFNTSTKLLGMLGKTSTLVSSRILSRASRSTISNSESAKFCYVLCGVVSNQGTLLHTDEAILSLGLHTLIGTFVPSSDDMITIALSNKMPLVLKCRIAVIFKYGRILHGVSSTPPRLTYQTTLPSLS